MKRCTNNDNTNLVFYDPRMKLHITEDFIKNTADIVFKFFIDGIDGTYANTVTKQNLDLAWFMKEVQLYERGSHIFCNRILVK